MPNNTGLLKTGAVVGIAVLISGVVSLSTGVPSPGFPLHRAPVGMEAVLRIKLFVTTLNVVILLALLWNYVAVYRDMPNRFTLSLLLVTAALLLYAVSSNPLLPLLLGFRHGTTLGPFVFIPDVFASVAAVVLLYQSYS
ncbi:hypothetical protein [Natronomonas sp. LN261]|jgi:hypothetical protein|uniref:hypothetical protein n=1 Tax=Natronomonas sp. LN261 TaxID=2750669 RepID=UPI0021053C3A|nr:hypothetical protein [Natronomonas sp. LN261]